MNYRIGVDGGGTKTELILVDSAGTVVATHTAPGCNPSQTGPAKAHDLLLASLTALLGESRIDNQKLKIGAIHLYMAGSPSFWSEFASTLTGYGRVVTGADSVPVLELATNGAAGLVLHAGTGSFVAARAPDGSIHYAGGLGWKLGDAGSGFDLGRRGIAQALLELQGWARPSELGEALKAHTGLADVSALTRFFHADPEANARIAAFAPRVVELAGQGCQPAQTQLTEVLSELVGLARLVTAKLFGGAAVPCGVSGPILNSEPAGFALKALVATHHWPVALNFITTPPIEGVRRLLLADR